MDNTQKLKNFLQNEQNIDNNHNFEPQDDKTIIFEKSGLLERVDKVLITKDGKQLLREQDFETNMD